MKTLLLLRHAKSDWADPVLEDHARPLNKRGRKSAPAIGDWIRDNDLAPDEVFSSDSVRTVETWDLSGLAGQAIFSRELYHAEPRTLFDCLAEAAGDRVMIIGHNPGISEFAARLLRTPPEHPRFVQYPTAALLVADFHIDDWADLVWHSGTAREFITPHQFGIGKL